MLVKHKDLSVEQVTKIGKSLLAHARQEPFWGKFTRHQPNEEGYTEISWRKLIYNNVTVADLKNLEEGKTPDPSKLSYAEFKCGVADYGNWIPYTDKSKRYNYDDVVRDAKNVLSDDAQQQAELRKAVQFYKGTCTITALTGDNGFLKTLLKAKTILKKNKAKTVVDGKFVAILPDEIANQVLVDYQKVLTDTSEKNAIIEGYIGCLGGFILYSRTDEPCYKNNTTGYVIFMGKSVNGLPVGTVSIGDSNVSVYDNGLGSIPEYDEEKGIVKPDALHQRGSVGYKVMGFGTRIIDDEAILRCEMPLEKITEGSVVDSNRQHFVRTSTSPVEETTE